MNVLSTLCFVTRRCIFPTASCEASASAESLETVHAWLNTRPFITIHVVNKTVMTWTELAWSSWHIFAFVMIIMTQFYFCFDPIPTSCFPPSAQVMADESLQSIFRHVYVTQNFIHQLEIAEDAIIDVSDFWVENQIGHAAVFTTIRENIQQLRVQLHFILSIQLLEACRKIERYVRQHGRLPLMSLDFCTLWHLLQGLNRM